MSPRRPSREVSKDTCAAPECDAPPAGESGQCLAHLDSDALESWLADLGGTGDLDATGVSLSKALLQRVLDAVPLDGDGRRRLRRADLDNAIFESDVLFDGFVFEERASFANTSFRGHGRFGGVQFDGPAVFAGGTFSTHAWFMGTTFSDEASFEGTRFDGPAWFGQSVFEGAAEFGGAAFASDLLAPGARFGAAATFVNARFGRKVRFDDDAFDHGVLFDGAVFEVAAETPASVKAEAKRLADERAPAPAPEEAMAPPPRMTPPPPRRSRRALLPWVGLLLLVALAGVYVTRGEGTKADFVPFARGDESAFRFLLKDPVTDRPVRYNPCQVLRYVVNPELGPQDWRSVVRDAAREVTRATGIKLQFEGVTDEVVRADLEAVSVGVEDPEKYAAFYNDVFNRPSYQAERYGADRWAPILIGWAVLGDTPPNENVEVLGVGASDVRVVAPRQLPDGGTAPGFASYVSGVAAINTNVPRRYLKTALMHELGHVLGLAHIQDNVAIMRPNTRTGAPAWSAGDLSGLRKVGRPAGCLPSVPPQPGP